MRFDYENEPKRGGFAAKAGPYLGGAILLAAFAGVVYFLIDALSGPPPPPKQTVQQISLVQPPPPPPPPPPKTEPPPEPEVEEVKVDEPEPEQQDIADSDPPPGDDLGIDADGVAGGDAFGLRAKKGGRGLIGGAHQFGWYAGILQKDIHLVLSDIAEIRKGRYSVVLRIWVATDGTVSDAEIVQGSGSSEVDAALARALANGVRVSQAPPDDMPQPVKLRINSRT